MLGSLKWIYKVICTKVNSIKNDILLLQAFIGDYFRYRKASLCHNEPFRRDKMNARLMLVGHSIEKGMSFESKKKNWGKEKVLQLCKMLVAYMQEYPVSEEVINCLNIINAYRLDDESCKSSEVTDCIDSILEQYHDYIQEGYAGVKDVIKPDSFDINTILSFYKSRASVRSFSEEPLTQMEIEKVMEVARTTPTACNRQTSRVYAITNRAKIDEILNLQLGGQGWADRASTMFIITGCMSCFGGIFERQQVYIDGGLFAMNFVMGLHLYGIASCFKMFVRDYKLQDKVCKLCGIPRNEVPIVIVMAGHYKNTTVKDPISHRFDYKVNIVS